MNYFQRPHSEVCRHPISGPPAWRGAELGDLQWSVTLSAAEIAELDAALVHLKQRQVELADMRREDFPLPGLASRLSNWAREVHTGRGFVLIRGFPVARWGDADAARVYWAVGLYLGAPGAQNAAGELLGHVTDYGEESTSPFVRRYRTAGDIAFHCDLADAVGLLCLRGANRGGSSRIVSSVAVYNELLRRRPDLVDRLYEPFYLDTRDEQPGAAPYVPVPACRYDGRVLRTFYHSDYFRSAQRHSELPRFSPLERELLDLYEAIANSPELYLDMQFQAGDLQLISNHTILHARTAYEDSADPRRKRHLLRLWLTLSFG